MDPTLTSVVPNAPAKGPWLPPTLVLSVVLIQLLLYGGVFGFVYAQLWLVLRYGHKRLSYQTSFLGLVLLWSGLRTLMVSFYFSPQGAGGTRGLSPALYWSLYGLPVCLQFTTLSLMTLYCAQVYVKAKAKFSPALLKYRPLLYVIFVAVVLIFSLVNLLCALLVWSSADVRPVLVRVLVRPDVVLVRVLVNDGLFVLCAVCLSVCLYKVSRMSTSDIRLHSKGPSVCLLVLLGLALVLVYSSRACYNLLVLTLTDHSPQSTQKHWYHISDQLDLCPSVGDPGLMVFALVLLVWELLPTALAAFCFRVRPPHHHVVPVSVPSHVLSSRGYFFDNPHRYDSDEDLWSQPHTSRVSSECDFNDEQRLTSNSGELHHYP